VALLVGVILGLALLRGGGSPVVDEAPSDGSSASPDGPEQSPDPPGSTTASEPESPETSEAAPPGGVSRSDFVEDYYADLPEDTENGYARLAPSYQDETSYDSYVGFWSTVDEVVVQDTAPAAGGAVDVTLSYDGEEEVRRIYLVRGDEGWLIADDEVVG
jgi:hypothetical protein